MNRVFVSGLGAVSPAGWSLRALRDALATDAPLPINILEQPAGHPALKVRVVPGPEPRPAFLTHPRLRRTSPLTHYAASAVLEAVAGRAAPDQAGRFGLIFCLQTGPVQHASRFFGEVLKDPGTASPLLFPETVSAAPAGHIAALLNDTPLAYTLLGDPAAFLQGVALAADWLADGRVDNCVIVGAEEINWLNAGALWSFDHRAVMSSGAGAIALTCDPIRSLGVELQAITDVHTYSTRQSRLEASCAMRRQLPMGSAAELLCDGLNGQSRWSEAESTIWQDWPGARLSPKRLLGEGLMAAAAWQCVAACDAIAQGRCAAANVSLVGCNQQAIGARFVVQK